MARRPNNALSFDPAPAVAHLRAGDPVLRAVIEAVGPYALEARPAKSLFQALARAITFQQLNGKAASAIHARVLAVLGKHGGPTPEALAAADDAELLGAGLSRAKLAALRDLSEKCLQRVVPTLAQARRLGDEELVERLTRVRGIGPWTVHMLLIFTLGRPDVMPIGDFAIRAAFKKLYRRRKDPAPKLLLKHAQKWRPYRSVACWYLWQSLELVPPGAR